jgi:pimeloyl-ACP methyl ester carboxylesterase/DNA-binding CsgD family transcriptional regulator
MEQRTGFLEYDGGRVAYAIVGEGPPLVLPAFWISHVGEDWCYPSFRRFVESLAHGRTVVRYDRPGTGLSDRDRRPETLTLDYERDLLSALVDALGFDRVALFGSSAGGPIGVAYAARCPERVERLVLYGTFAAGTSIGTPETRAAMVQLVGSSWGLGSRVLADVFGPSASVSERRELAAIQRTAATAATAARLIQLMYACDVRDVLSTMAVPTLVVHREGDRAIPVRLARELVALVPGAELMLLPGDAHPPWHGDSDRLVDAIAPFLGIRPPAAASPVSGDPDELTAREREVLRLVAEGLSDSEIAARLVVSPHTVHRHVANVRRKLGLHSRSAAAAHAARAGLI